MSPTSPPTATKGTALLGASDPRTNAAGGEVGGRYGVIYMDPPWWYADQTQKNSGASDHYDLMSDDELRAFGEKVDGWADSDCALAMWATGARLDFACELLSLWGWRFVTTLFVWIKLYPKQMTEVCGQGRYTRSSCEYVLLGARGSIPVAQNDVPQLLETEVVALPRTSKHSEKPNEFRRRIEGLWPTARRLEVFCRHAPPGWDVWGNQVGLLSGGPKTIKPWRDDGQMRLFGGEA